MVAVSRKAGDRLSILMKRDLRLLMEVVSDTAWVHIGRCVVVEDFVDAGIVVVLAWVSMAILALQIERLVVMI